MPEQVPRKAPLLPTALAPLAALLAITATLAAAPAGTLAAALAGQPLAIIEEILPPHRLILLARSLLVALLIAVISAAIATPLSRLFIARYARHRAILATLALTPAWLPPFMIYAAGNLLRAPDTAIGGAIIRFATSSPDLRWVTIWIGYALAVLGLALWATPLAAVLIAAGTASRSAIHDEMLALEPIGPLRRAIFRFRLDGPVILRAITLIAILMLGSAVPLHLAQLDTWSIVIWRQISESPPSQWGRAWVAAVPMILCAILGARIITRMLHESHAQTDNDTRRPEAPPATIVTAAALFALAVILPLAALIASLRDARSLARFWITSAEPLSDTAITAAAVGVTAAAITLCTAATLGSPVRAHRRAAKACVFTLTVLGLTPGVLIGAAIAQNGILGFQAPRLEPYFASLCRYAFVAAVIGTLVAAAEDTDRRHARFQLAGPSIRAWMITVAPSAAKPACAAGIITAVLAIFEIEAAVMVTPPGIQSLPQRLLADLHYARLEQLSAAGANLLAIGAAIAIAASAIIISHTEHARRTSN